MASDREGNANGIHNFACKGLIGQMAVIIASGFVFFVLDVC